MLKKIIIAITLSLSLLLIPQQVSAQEQNCVQIYGGGVVCGAQAPEEHEPVDTDFEIEPFILISSALLTSSVFLLVSLKLRGKLA